MNSFIETVMVLFHASAPPRQRPLREPKGRAGVAPPHVAKGDGISAYRPALARSPGRRDASLPLPRPTLRFSGWLLLAWLTVAAGLMAWLARRSRRIATSTRQAIPAPDTPGQLLDVCRRHMRIGRRIRLKLSTSVSSPAVYGL